MMIHIAFGSIPTWCLLTIIITSVAVDIYLIAEAYQKSKKTRRPLDPR
jgi:hypothetical protein